MIEANTPQQYVDDLIDKIDNETITDIDTFTIALLSVEQSIMFCDKSKLEFLTECKMLLEPYRL